MSVKLKYAGSEISVELPEFLIVDQFGLKSTERSFSFEDFKKSFNSNNGDRFIKERSPLFIINDSYRNTPTEKIFVWLDEIDNSLLSRSNILIATGTHPIPTKSQLESILGKFYPIFEGRISSHAATDLSDMVLVGQDHFGKDVYINRLVLESQSVIIIGSVEPHYFAGYTGGRKSLFPGLTDLATIERNHNLANSLEAAPLKINGNPVAEHLNELLFLLDFEKKFTIQVVMDSYDQIKFVSMGNIDRAFTEATSFADELFVNRVPDQYDLVLAEVRSPLDKNLYQIQKGLENCQSAIADGGTAIVVAACSEGVGSDYFFELADGWDRQTNLPTDGVIKFGSHKLARVNAMSQRIRPGLYSELPADSVKNVFYEPIENIELTIKELINRGKCKRVAVVYDAGQTVLQVT